MKLKPKTTEEKKALLKKEIEKNLIGKLLSPVFPYFVPWEESQSGFRKMGNILPMDKLLYEARIPVLVIEISESLYYPDGEPIRHVLSYTETELWIKCLWYDRMVYHRVTEHGIYMLKQMVITPQELAEYGKDIEMSVSFF